MPGPRVSIITANFNSGDKLVATWESLSDQQVEFEYLILDGASTDGSLELGQALARQDPRVRVWSERDSGVYDAMNKGIALASGEYLYFLGAGDFVLPGRLKEMASRFPENPLALVYGDVIAFGLRYDGRFSRNKLAMFNLCHQAVFYSRAVFDRVGTYDTRYRAFADWDLNLRCFADPAIKRVYAPVVVGTFEPGGVSYRGDPLFTQEQPRLIRKYFGPYVAHRAALTKRLRAAWGVVNGSLPEPFRGMLYRLRKRPAPTAESLSQQAG